jgi:hypothetical protein
MEARLLRVEALVPVVWFSLLRGNVEDATRLTVRAGGVGEKSGWETTRVAVVVVVAAGMVLGVGLGMAERGGLIVCSWWWEVRMEGIWGGMEAGWVVERR